MIDYTLVGKVNNIAEGGVMTFMHYIYFKKSPVDFQSILVRDCNTKQEAIDHAEDMARRSGWHNPKWYEYWRWGDRKVFQSATKPNADGIV